MKNIMFVEFIQRNVTSKSIYDISAPLVQKYYKQLWNFIAIFDIFTPINIKISNIGVKITLSFFIINNLSTAQHDRLIASKSVQEEKGQFHKRTGSQAPKTATFSTLVEEASYG